MLKLYLWDSNVFPGPQSAGEEHRGHRGGTQELNGKQKHQQNQQKTSNNGDGGKQQAIHSKGPTQ